jgi:hypothetical protein
VAIREVAVDPVVVTYDEISMVKVEVLLGMVEGITTFDQVVAHWDIPQPGGGTHKFSVKLAKAESDLLDVAPVLGREMLDAIRDMTKTKAHAVFDQLWGA